MAINAKRAITRILRSSSSCSMPGVWRAVTYCQGIAVVFHSPKACAHVARTMDIGSHFRAQARLQGEPFAQTVPLVTSLLDEKHSIFGGEKQLEKCLEYTFATYQPKCIVVANSCVAGVIGDDIIAVAQKFEQKRSLPVLPVNCSGFLDGEFFEGYYETTKALIEHFMSKQATDLDSVFLIGDYGGPKGAYAKELKRLLAYFGLEVKGQFPTYTSFDELPKVASSSLNIVLGGRKHAEKSVEKIAVLLHEKFGTPYYAKNYPLGWNNTVKWLEGLGQMLDKADCAQRAVNEQSIFREKILDSLREKSKGKKALLCLGRRVNYFQPQWVIEIIESLSLELIGVVLLDCYVDKDKKDMIEEVQRFTDAKIYTENEAAEVIDACDLVLTTHELNMPEKRQFYIPMLPATGVTGELEMMEKIVRLLYRRGGRGGIVYG